MAWWPSGGDSLANVVKLNVYLTDLHGAQVPDRIMAGYITGPYPARDAIGVDSAVGAPANSSRRMTSDGYAFLATAMSPVGLI